MCKQTARRLSSRIGRYSRLVHESCELQRFCNQDALLHQETVSDPPTKAASPGLWMDHEFSSKGANEPVS